VLLRISHPALHSRDGRTRATSDPPGLEWWAVAAGERAIVVRPQTSIALMSSHVNH